MNKKEVYSIYCTGCGLCQSYMNVIFEYEKNGFSHPILSNKEEIDFCEKVCPANGKHLMRQTDSIWGHYLTVFKGYSTNKEIRYKAASGGVITSLAIFLLKEKKVDGIIQIGEKKENPFATQSYLSITEEDIINRCGSRYIVSSPLSEICQILEKGGKYVFIGRPCDIIALNNFLIEFPKFRDNIFCTLTFFCAGVPSVEASKRLVASLGIKPSEVRKIRYRGYGWPGQATIFDSKNVQKSMDYIISWNQFLGRDIRSICKFCTDGVGEDADISCGDLWNLKNERPYFEESEGLNVIFSRTNKGNSLLIEAFEKGYIQLSDYQENIKELYYVQPNHSTKKKFLYPRLLGLKLIKHPIPYYNLKKLKVFCKKESFINNLRNTIGTMRRAILKKI